MESVVNVEIRSLMTHGAALITLDGSSIQYACLANPNKDVGDFVSQNFVLPPARSSPENADMMIPNVEA